MPRSPFCVTPRVPIQQESQTTIVPSMRAAAAMPGGGRLLAQFPPTVEQALISHSHPCSADLGPCASGRRRGAGQGRTGLYLASADAMLRRIRAVDADTLLLVAHNPGSRFWQSGCHVTPRHRPTGA